MVFLRLFASLAWPCSRNIIRTSFFVTLVTPWALALPSVVGTVQDDSRGKIDEARVTVWDAASGRGLMTSTVMGSFAFNEMTEGDYLFKIEKDDKKPVYGALHLAGDTPHEITVVMLSVTNQDGSLIGAASPLRGSNRPPRTSTKPPKVKPAQVTKKIIPIYPESAKKAGAKANVRIATIILPGGTVDDLVVLSAPSADFALNALLAVRNWRYSPTYLDGEAVEASLTIDVNFEH